MANRLHGGDPKKMRPPKVKHARLKDVMLPEMLEAALCSARLIGDCCVLVENHCGLCVLESTRIAVATKCGLLEVRGEALSLDEVRPDTLLVRGRIGSVGYGHA